jgi:ribosomal protein S18 acetylase RimI-like enzyme
MELVIDRANLDDIEGLVHVYNSDGVEHLRALDSYPLTQWILDQNSNLLVAKVSRKPVAFIFTRKKGNEVKIDLFSVSKKYRGKGAEKRLLDQIELAEDVSKITTYLPKSDKSNLALFKKQGYLVYNEVKNLFGEEEHGLYLIKDLTKIKVERPKREKRETKSEKAAKSYLDENLGKLDVYLEP